MVREHVKYIIIVYLLLAFLLYKLKPSMMFDDDKIKKFGVGPGKTVFSYHITLIFVSLILFYLFEVIWLKKNNFL